MELQIAKRCIKAMEILPEEVSEESLDCDLLLPDYLPDIAAIFKCIAEPMVQHHQISGDRVMVEGTTKIQILYSDEERNNVYTFETVQAFGCSFPLKETKDDSFIKFFAQNNVVNCRAISPRRVDIHGTFSVKLIRYAEREKICLELPLEKECQTKVETVPYSRLVGGKSKSFTINETLELADSVEAHTLLRSSAVSHVTECKAIKNKAIVKGEVFLRTIYVMNGESGKIGCSENHIPFSQIVDLEGLEEDHLCFCQTAVSHCEVHPAQTTVGENKLLSVSLKINLELGAFCTENVSVLTDAYRTDCTIKNSMELMEFCAVTTAENRLESASATWELPDTEIEYPEDLWCDIESVSESLRDEGKILAIAATVSMLTRNKNHSLAFYERPIELNVPLQGLAESNQIRINVLKTAWRIQGTFCELTVTLAVEFCTSAIRKIQTVSEMEMMEKENDEGKEKKEKCCAKIYFAEKGESVWEIGKKHRIAIENVCYENNLTADDVLQNDCMIMLTP
ncbi:MAG: DUF3794 domain-containing protein [Clostridia bacterium]|nr:DUF3794 domain-containing protein [Clostridia bacterium]